jgi:putative ABC transport system ATP-binding protein
MLELRDIHVSFATPGATITALDGVDLTIADGEFITVIGANGAGKTTLVNVIAGAQQPQRGSIRLGGRDVRRLPEHRRAGDIARVFHNTQASLCGELTIEENLMLALTRRGRRRPWRRASTAARRATALEALERYGPVLTQRLHQRAGTLSSGQGQLLAIVMAVIARPRLLLLDEHTSALDPTMSERVMTATAEVVRREGLSTLMITHHMRIAACYGDRLVMMGRGRIVDELAGDADERRDEGALIDRFRSAVTDGLSDRMLA